jgi:hypothetical protein
MKSIFQWAVTAALCAGACVRAQAAAAELDGVKLDDSAQVAGQNLRLNGAGLSQRLVFKIYAISLYLPEPEKTAEAVLNCDGPSRIAIVMLRDVSGAEFSEAMAESVSRQIADAGAAPPENGLVHVGMTIASQPRGLRKGDHLTLDWVPGIGTVIELNQKPLTAPIADRSVYNALLNVWLGAKPADTSLKTRLLGLSPA